MLWFLIILGVIAVVVVAMYNSLVRLRVRSDSAWADIDVQLKRRWDLVPNLVETVKGYASHEKDTLEAVIEARNRAMGASGPAEKGAAEGMLSGALGKLLVSLGVIALTRKIRSLLEEQKLGAIETDPFGAMLRSCLCVLAEIDVSRESNDHMIDRLRRKIFVGKELLFSVEPLRLFGSVLLLVAFRRV